MAPVPASGTQHMLRFGDYAASIASVGATVRSLTHAGRDLVVPFDADEVRPSYRGATLAPWPNRIVDGTYRFAGREYQTALTEPARAHALHGLVGWLDFEPVHTGPNQVTLVATIEPQSGYPWRVRVQTDFVLDANGLSQSVRAQNLSAEAAPWGTATHPYLVAGPGTVNDWTLQLPATQVLAVTADRLIPTGLHSVHSHHPEQFDFRSPRQLGDVFIDHAFTGLQWDQTGQVAVRVTHPAGTGVQMVWQTSCPWVQIHTADKPSPELSRLGLAVEPMTCAPDAFNQDAYGYDAGLITLAAGGQAEASWRIAAL